MNDYYGLNLFTKAVLVSFFVLAVVFMVAGTIFGEQGPGRILFAEEKLVTKIDDKRVNNWSVLYEANLPIGQPRSLAVSGDYLLLGDRGIKIIDLLDFKNQQQLTLPVLVNSISVLDKRAYLATNNPNQELAVVDIGRGLRPLLIGGFDLAGEQSALKAIVSEQGKLVVAKKTGFFIFNIVFPDRPMLIGQLLSEDFQVNDFVVVGEQIVAAMSDGRLRIIDITQARIPRLTASLDLQCGQLKSITVKGERAYITCAGEQPGLVIVNIKNPFAPLSLSQTKIERVIKQIVFVDKKRAFFLLEGGSNNVQLWNLANDLLPQREATVTAGDNPQIMIYNKKLRRLIVGNKVVRPE